MAHRLFWVHIWSVPFLFYFVATYFQSWSDETKQIGIKLIKTHDQYLALVINTNSSSTGVITFKSLSKFNAGTNCTGKIQLVHNTYYEGRWKGNWETKCLDGAIGIVLGQFVLDKGLPVELEIGEVVCKV